MSKILIFQSPTIEKEQQSLRYNIQNIEENQFIFDNLKINLKNKIEEQYLDHFQNLENQNILFNNVISKGISLLIAKELIKYLIPLVTEIPESINKKNITVRNKMGFKQKTLQNKQSKTPWA